jgi:hypothetical protein
VLLLVECDLLLAIIGQIFMNEKDILDTESDKEFSFGSENILDRVAKKSNVSGSRDEI